MWSILGSQSEERTPILGSGAGFAAQKQFLANVEAANVQAGGRGSERSTEKDICCPVQNRGKLDFMLGKQLYMCPSDMYRVANHIEGYNNKIQIATTAMLPGTNQSLNTEKLPPTGRPFIVTHGAAGNLWLAFWCHIYGLACCVGVHSRSVTMGYGTGMPE